MNNMNTSREHLTSLSDEAATLLDLGPGGSDDMAASLKALLDKLTTTSHTESAEKALQLLGTAVGTQSRRIESLKKPS